MQNSKLHKLLKSLKNEEFRQLKKFLESPFHNSNPKILDLYELIKKYSPNFDSPLLDRKVIFKKLYSQDNYNAKKIGNLFHKMSTLVETFLLNLRFDQNEFKRKQQLAEIYGERNSYDLFEKSAQNYIRILSKLQLKGVDYHRELMMAKHQLYFHPTTFKYDTSVNTIHSAIADLDYFYILSRLRYNCELKARNNALLDNALTVPFLPDTEELSSQFSSDILFKVYREVWNLLSTDKYEDYLELKSSLTNSSSKVNRQEQRFILQHLLNFVIRQIKTNETIFLKESFDLYKLGIKRSLLILNNRITDTTFLNIVIAGAKLNEFKWISSFINQYEMYLEKSSRTEVITLCNAYQYFHQNEYEKTVSLLSQFEFKQNIFLLNSKSLLLRTYYELFLVDKNYYNFLNSFSLAFEKFMRRNRVFNQSKILAYLRFINISRKVFRSIHKDGYINSAKAKTLENQLESENIISKSWLLQKIKQAIPLQ